MINPIPMDNNTNVLELLNLQLLSYRVEAKLIGFDDIPPLLDSIHSLQQSNEIFIGFYIEKQLVGAVSYTREGDRVSICRLMVHPDHFRKGIARQLMEHVLSEPKNADTFVVSTGAANTPAIALYHSLGFIEQKSRTIAPGIKLVTFMMGSSRVKATSSH